jgi:hypothetical protein
MEHEAFGYPQLQGPGGEQVTFSGPSAGTWDVPRCAQYAYTGMPGSPTVEEQINVSGVTTTEFSAVDAQGRKSYSVGVYFPSNGACQSMLAVPNTGTLDHTVVDRVFSSAQYR